MTDLDRSKKLQQIHRRSQRPNNAIRFQEAVFGYGNTSAFERLRRMILEGEQTRTPANTAKSCISKES